MSRRIGREVLPSETTREESPLVTFLRTFSVSDGVTGTDTTPETEALYLTPLEAESIFGCSLSEQQGRFIQATINAHCNRTTLWPCEIETGPLQIPGDRQETRVPVTPVIRILEAAGRYGMQRRDRQGWNSFAYGLSPILALNAAARPQWTPINVDAIELSPAEGIVFLPWSSLLLPFSWVRIRYIAGLIQIPHRVKAAVIEIANNMSAKGVSDRQRYAVGRVSRQFASASFVTPLAESMLAPFVMQSLD